MLLKIVICQARHRWAVTLLLWIAMTALVGLYVYLDNSAAFTNRSMQLIMKSMGHNLLIVPADADPLAFHSCTDGQVLFDEDVVDRMASRRQLASKYYTCLLQQRVAVGDRTVILSGVKPVFRGDETAEKTHLTEPITSGRARLGADAAGILNASVGDRIELAGGSFEVESVVDALGSTDDYRVYVALDECQRLLGSPGRINAVLSFLCLQGSSLEGVSSRQRKLFGELFPEYRIVSKTRIAQGRYLARMTTNRYLYYLLGIVLCITMVIIVVTGFQEVAERKRELGILLAMGAGYGMIVGMYLLKLLAIAVAAGVTGFVAGSFLSRWLLTPVLVANTNPVTVAWAELPAVVGLTCLVATAAELLPIVKLIRMDPNTILIEE